jgi:NDP-sugar pyrophosphorylase family protein
MSKRAIILAGGKGTRLYPYTWVLPKPLMPIGDTPILEIIIRQLVSQGFTRVTLAVNHMAEIISAFFGDGSKWGIQIDYSLEDKPLSTMAPLKLIKDLPENFLIMNGDVLTDIHYGKLYDQHLNHNNLFTISAYRRQQASQYGVLDINEEKYLTGFREKPVTEYLVSMGVYVANRNVLNMIPSDTPYGFDTLMYDLLSRKDHPEVIEHPGYWLDIGRPDEYHMAIEKFEKDRDVFLK